MSHVERVIPVDDLRRIQEKYASKKPLWGRGNGSRAKCLFPDEVIGHIKWLHDQGTSRQELLRMFQVSETWIDNLRLGVNFRRIRASECLHKELLKSCTRVL